MKYAALLLAALALVVSLVMVIAGHKPKPEQRLVIADTLGALLDSLRSMGYSNAVLRAESNGWFIGTEILTRSRVVYGEPVLVVGPTNYFRHLTNGFRLTNIFINPTNWIIPVPAPVPVKRWETL